MMYLVYAVMIQEGEKVRFFLDSCTSLDAAKHMANCATLGNADYAYVKEIGGTTVFYLERINPDDLYGSDRQPLKIRPPTGQA